MSDIVTIGFRADTSGMAKAERGLNRVERAGAGVDNRLGSMRNNLRYVAGAFAALGVTVGVSGLARQFAEFESSMARVRAVSRATDAQFALLEKTARELGATTEFTAMQAASGLEFLARAGWSANESISALPAVLDLATAASMDLGVAADITSNIMSAFGIAATDAASVSDVLAAASSRANTDVQQLGSAMSYVGPVAAALKIPMGDAAAAVGALSDAGIQGSAAGTGLRRVLSSLANPTGNAAKALQGLGVELEAVNPATNSLVDIVDRLSQSGMSAADALTIFGDRGGPAILALVENNAKVRELSGALRDVGGEAERMADIIRDTLTGDMQSLGSAVSDVAISMGQKLSPGMRGTVQAATDLTRFIGENIDKFAVAAKVIGTVVAGLAVYHTAIILASVSTKAYTLVLAAFSTQAALTTASVMTLAGAMKVLASAGVAFIAGWQVGTYLREEFETVEKIGIAIAAGFQKTFATLEGQMNKIGANIGYALSSPLDFARTKIIDFFQWLASLGEGALSLLGLGGMMDGITEKLESWKPETEKQFKETLKNIEAETKEKIGNIDDIYADMFANVGAGSKELKTAEEEVLKLADAVEGLTDNLAGAGEGGAGKELEAIAKALNEIQRAADPAFAALQDYQAGMDTLAEGLLNNLIDDQQFVTLADHLLQVRDAALEAAKGMSWLDNIDTAMGGVAQGLSQIHSTMDSGSKEAEKLGVAMQALAVAQGIVAVINQGSGDPYTAFARMAAMAAAIAALGVNIGSMGGGGPSVSEERQATQGTGTVFGDSEAKSESILKATEITADATRDLVGINRAQLNALEAMGRAITGVTEGLIRGGGIGSIGSNINFGREAVIGSDAEYLNPLAPLMMNEKLFGGSELTEGLAAFHAGIWNDLNEELFRVDTDLIDQGIQLFGGSFGEIIAGSLAVAQGYADVEREKKLFGIGLGASASTILEDLGAETSGQILAVLTNMADAVTAGASALGIADDVIAERLNNFELEMQKISLKDLSSEEQQAELEAVFSSIFDELAGAVVPFLDDFAKAGEGFGETLVRVATQVQVAEEAMTQLGMSLLDGLAGLDLAQLSDDLISAAGGMENFITGFTGFVDKFATDEHKLSVATNSINSAMSQLGIEVPQSRDALWSLMQAITDPEQLAGLFRLQDSFATMFDMMDSINRERTGLNIQLLRLQGDAEEALAIERGIALDGMHESNRALQEQIWALQDLEAAADKAEQATKALADFQRGIADQILDIISPAHAELERLNRAMGAQIDQAQELGTAEEGLINMRRLHQLQLLEFAAGLEESIASLNTELFGSTENAMDRTVNAVDNGMNRIRESMIRAIDVVNKWLDSSMLSSVSPLTPEDRLGEAERQFNLQFAGAMGGDTDAMAALPKLADQLLSEASGFFGGSTQEFDQIWMQVRDAMEQVSGLSIPDAQDPQRAIQTATESTAMSALQQITLASDMIGQIAALSRVTGETPADIAERLGVPIGGLLDILESTPGEFAGAMDENFNDLVTGFDMTIDPLLSVQNAQLEETRQMRTEQNERLDRIEQALLDGVNYQRATAVNTGETANQQGQAVAIQRRNENKPSGAGRINV